MRTQRLSLPLAFALALVACTDPAPSQTAVASPKRRGGEPLFLKGEKMVKPDLPPGLTLAQIWEATLSARVYCANPTECPANVGMLYMAVRAKIDPKLFRPTYCTAVHLRDGYVLSAGHCIPSDLDPAQPCGDRLRLKLPGNLQSLKCDEIVSSSLHNPAHPYSDWALFHFENTRGLPAATLSDNGLPDALNLRLTKINPFEAFGMDGVLAVEDCTVNHENFFLPDFRSAADPVGTVGGCEVRPGNSGSPLWDKEGKLRGITYAVFHPSSEWNPVPRAPEARLGVGMVVNAACLNPDQPDDPWRPTAACQRGMQSSIGEAQQEMISRLSQEPLGRIQKEFESWTSADGSAELRFALSTLQPLAIEPQKYAPGYFLAVPKCVEAAHFQIGSPIEIALTVPAWTLEFRLNKLLHWETRVAHSTERILLSGEASEGRPFEARLFRWNAAEKDPRSGWKLTLSVCE